ncbi:MAG TPA: ABC transporter permease [Phycisphaerae bacterium]|nr:ABC transporter permease [Phycisphaerae bacterium]HNU45825.1 ABC transporter permease [Phycisphaerae bacterium]
MLRAEYRAGALPELAQYGQLLWSLAARDIRVRYKQSLLGVTWAVLLPLSMMLIFTFVFTRAVRATGLATDLPYALYAYSGLVPWTFFSMALTGCVNSLVANRNLVTKVYFPREVFPLACVGSALVDFAIALAVLVGLMAYFAAAGAWTFRPHAALALLPFLILVQMALTTGLGMLLAMANLFYRDVRQVVTVGLQLLLFVSGVVVPIPADGSLAARLLGLNPLVPLLAAYRDCLLYGRWPEGTGLLYATVLSLAVLLGGWAWFRRAAFKFAECI